MHCIILCERKHNLFIYLSPNFYFVCLTSSTTDTDTIVESLNPELNQKSFFIFLKKENENEKECKKYVWSIVSSQQGLVRDRENIRVKMVILGCPMLGQANRYPNSNNKPFPKK